MPSSKPRNSLSPRVRVVVDCGGIAASRTKQSEADKCDINKLMARYASTGTLTHINSAIPQYGDFSNVDDYHSALIKVRLADSAFAELPAQIRRRFANDPGLMSEFVSDQANYKEALEMGLITQEAADEVAATLQAQIVPTPTPVEGGEAPITGANATD